jgi:hypothetical protein
MHTTPRYRRRPDLDQVAAWESLTDGTIRFAAPSYDLNSAEALAADAFMALPLSERAAQIEARAAADARSVAHAPPLPAERRTTLETADLGGGVRYALVALHAAVPGQGMVFMGTVHVLASADGRTLELDTNARELHRQVSLVVDGTSRFTTRASSLLIWADLLSRPAVLSALRLWAAEDNAEDYAEGEQLAAADGEGGGL